MDLTFTSEHRALRSSVRQFLERSCPEPEVRRVMDTAAGCDPTVWKQLCDELALTSLAIPEEFGGTGCGPVETGIVFEEMGRAMFCGPYFATVALAANLLQSLGDRQAMATYLPRIASGNTVATVALAERSCRWDAEGITVAALPSSDGWRLDGHKLFVVDGCLADLILVVARTAGGISVFAVDGIAPRLERTPMTTIDQTRKLASLHLDNVAGVLLGEEGRAWPAVSRTIDLAAVALAAEQVGGAERVLEMAADYARTREQFGRPIGSFQAIKHRCADMLVEVESARSMAYYAMWAGAEASGELPVAASLAKAFCSEAFAGVAAGNIQVHGGIGFTWEHPAHIYFKRAKTSQVLFGDPAYHRELAARRLGI